MKEKLVVLMVWLTPMLSYSQNEWVLQPWMQVKGQIAGEGLGLRVTRVTPRPNLPYKATIAKVGSFGFYSLESPTDTLPKKVFRGNDLLTEDLNGDGYTDLVVLRRDTVFNGYDTVYVFWGNPTGVDTVNPVIIPNENRYDDLRLGCIGDVNNDGKLDLVLTASNYGKAQGKVYFYFGPIITITPNATMVGDSAFSHLGIKCVVGDLNKDGLNDIIVAGSGLIGNTGPNGANYVNIYWGTASNKINLVLGAQMTAPGVTSGGLAVFDVNGDGIDDLLWTSRDSSTSRINIHYGRQVFLTSPDLRLKPPSFAGFSFDIINGGDLNGDGYNDVVIGGSGFQDVYHFVLVYAGGNKLDEKFDAAVGTENASHFSQSIVSVGDINSDGCDDILVGAPQYGRFGLNENKGYWGIFLGDKRFGATVVPPIVLPKGFALQQNYPNPFNPSTIIEFTLASSAHVVLTIYDSIGKEIKKLVDQNFPSGRQATLWDGTNSKGEKVSSGVYYYQIVIDGKSIETKKTVFLK